MRGADVDAPATRVGANPHSCWRSRDTRGTHSVAPPIPARTNTHPRLSTYWFAENDAGGNSAGPDVSRRDCADAVPATKAAITATVERNPDRRSVVCPKYNIVAPTRYCGRMQNNAYNVKGLSPLFCAKHTGEASKHKNRISVAPDFLRRSIAAIDELPVANIGSTAITKRSFM